MNEFFCNFDWDGFWLNVLVSSIFFIIGIPVALRLIPYYMIKRLKRKNSNYINRKISSVIQETCDFILNTPFKDNDLNKEHISIFTNPKDVKNYHFIGLSNINVYDPIVFHKVIIVVIESLQKREPDSALKILVSEKNRLSLFRSRLESIIDIHSSHVDDDTISKISHLCLEIRSFELKFKYNYSIDDLIESGKTERIGVYGINELSNIYVLILKLLKKLVDNKNFIYKIESPAERSILAPLV